MTSRALAGVYECSGLRVASELALPALRSEVADPADADVYVRLGGVVDQPFERPSADLVAELVVRDYLCYTICQVEDGFVLRLPWIADFAIDRRLRRVVCHPAASGRSELIPLIVPGTLTAFLLAMRDRLVLHGSAVDLGGRAIAFVGLSGQGKSTMAAIFCAAGASLLGDDVLPIEFGSDQHDAEGVTEVFGVRSGHEIRLRDKAEWLAGGFDDDAVRFTPDERRAVSPRSSPCEKLPLSCIVLPRPDRERRRVEVTRLSQGEASLALGRCQRIEGWRRREHLRQQFDDIGRVVASVPVFVASLPWGGGPSADDLATQVLDACGIDATVLAGARAPGAASAG